MSVISIKSNELTVAVKSFGAELASVKDNTGKEYLWQANPDVWPNQAPVLFPIVSRLRNGSRPGVYTLDGK